MLANSKLVAFATTQRADQAKAFYTEVLGLTLIADTYPALVLSANGATLRMQKVETVVLSAGTVLGWDVPDIRATINGLARRGVVFERYESMSQDETGVWTAPGGALVAWFKDPDGNTLSLTQHPPGISDPSSASRS